MTRKVAIILGGALNNVSAFLSNLGRGEAALDASEEAVGHYRNWWNRTATPSSPIWYSPWAPTAGVVSGRSGRSGF
jgi:hypothetical protein